MPKVSMQRPQLPPSCAGLVSRLAYERATQEGVNARELLRQAGLTVADIRESSTRLSVPSQIRFVELVADAIGDPELGVHLAKDFDLRRLNLLYYVPSSADTLGAALLRLERYSGLANESVVAKVNKGRSVRISLEYAGVARHTDRQQIECFITALIRLCRHLVARNLKPLHVRLAHPRRFANNDLDKFAGVAIERSAGADEIVLAATSWTLPVASTDPHLHRLLVGFCEEALLRRETKSSSLRVRVENSIAALLPHGQALADVVAGRLGMSPRTLARRLAAEELKFSKILRELRSTLASRYLAEPALSVSQVAWLLGYGEIGAFSHAFRRWTGITPSEARDRFSPRQAKTNKFLAKDRKTRFPR